jgi:peptidoglycan hydrolase-like protein with peptidoglycan-binding domain
MLAGYSPSIPENVPATEIPVKYCYGVRNDDLYQGFNKSCNAGDSEISKEQYEELRNLPKPRHLSPVQFPELATAIESAGSPPTATPGSAPEVSQSGTRLAAQDPKVVAAVQLALNSLGFDAGPADGQFGGRTQNAIREYQHSLGIAEDGQISPGLVTSLQTAVTVARVNADALPLEKAGGVYTLPVRINDAITLKFVLDSGAADVSIPADVVLTLVRTGTIQSRDFIGTQTYIQADGSKLQSDRFILHEFRIGNHSVKDVTASVAPAEGELLLGQSFLSKLPAWTINYKRSTLLISSE